MSLTFEFLASDIIYVLTFELPVSDSVPRVTLSLTSELNPGFDPMSLWGLVVSLFVLFSGNPGFTGGRGFNPAGGAPRGAYQPQQQQPHKSYAEAVDAAIDIEDGLRSRRARRQQTAQGGRPAIQGAQSSQSSQ
ncbi:hypothetical protein F511_25050 [Dorcoceras hygrometricum]|uniref:Uncharacterized protein n=1 Tax=Dorcoceras hygrometricum TaxID=472368 RepID=A0A2Z7B663_9LAMI|nr:hypothetical protein F511_25050 [Dorcoceras hygrometricum]